MDVIDRAQEREQFTQELTLKEQLRNRKSEKPLFVDGIRVCRDCECTIPEERIRVKPDAVRCVRCQERHEHGF